MKGFNWKFVLKVAGIILIIESLFLFISSGVSFYFERNWVNDLLLSACFTFVVGFIVLLFGGIRKKFHLIGKKESFFSVALSWLLFALFGSLPFFLSGHFNSFSDAFFESTSGITTTGASVLNNIDNLPKGLLFWRSLLQWLGGMGIIVFTLALLPLIGNSSSQLFDAESSGLTHDKFRPRVTQMAKRLWGIYLLLTISVILLLAIGPMNWYDAFCHGFSTISTGGFSTKQISIAYWDSNYIQGVIMVFMLLGSINFVLLYFLVKGQFKRFFQDEELRWFFGIILFSIFIISLGLIFENNLPIVVAIRDASFQTISLFTTTGYATVDYTTTWEPPLLVLLLFLMVVCGCAGSTSGGLKTVRAVVLVKDALVEFKRLVHPRAIIPVRLNGNALPFGVVQRLLAFVFLYIAIILISWFILCIMGLTIDEALSASVSAISNVGPGFGSIGPMNSYAEIPTLAKWYLSFLMIVGRLEIFTVLILFTPGFWKQ
ncbi:TrkH family potassium uptake protein [Bacteroidales bacterium OttesenSCG-928-M11]|nr:TrkH family potassium uptake protein [Bacteroidales bacterium OttesenSCG-928-M11]